MLSSEDIILVYTFYKRVMFAVKRLSTFENET